MNTNTEIDKPDAVRYAVWALSAWTAWVCLYGSYETWKIMPQLQEMIATELRGQVLISTATILKITFSFYAMMALSMVWIIYKIDQGKNWARISMLISLILQVVVFIISPNESVRELLPLVPDIGLQFYANFMLFSESGKIWFTKKPHQT